MNRENLLKNLCPSKNIDLCRSETGKIDCIDCNNVMNTYLDEYDKHIIAECEAEHGNLADMKGCKIVNIAGQLKKFEENK